MPPTPSQDSGGEAPTPFVELPVVDQPLVDLDGDGQYFVGQLVTNELFDDITPSAYCLEDGHLWRGSPWRVGRLNLFVGGDVPDDLAGEVVLVRGAREPSLAELVVDDGPCPQEESAARQFRSDWMADEGGYRTRRERLAAVEALRGVVVQPVTLLEVTDPNPGGHKLGPRGASPESGGEPVQVVVRNPFSRPLEGLTLLVHHEGGPTKPMPRYARHPVTLGPGEALSLEVPAVIDERASGERGVWRFHSAHLMGRSGNLEVLGSPFFQLPEAGDVAP